MNFDEFGIVDGSIPSCDTTEDFDDSVCYEYCSACLGGCLHSLSLPRLQTESASNVNQCLYLDVPSCPRAHESPFRLTINVCV